VEDVAGQALRVDPDEDVLLAGDVALDQRHVVLAVDQRAVADRRELAEPGRQAGLDHALDELVVLAPVRDQVGDRDHLQPVAPAVALEVGDARHLAVVAHHLADHARGIQAREPGEVDRRLGLARALQHAAGLGLQGEHVAGLDQIARGAVRIDRDLDRARAVGGADPGGDPFAGLDRDRERGLERRLVLGRHQLQAEFVAALRRQSEADQPAPLLGHEVDRLGRRELGGEGQVTLVLAVLVVADDHHPSGADLLQRLFDARERPHRVTSFSTYLASTSTSILTRCP
jgi:hypothetical protein